MTKPVPDPLPNRDPNPPHISCECGYIGPSTSLHCYVCDALLATCCPGCDQKTPERKCPNGCVPPTMEEIYGAGDGPVKGL